MGGIQTLPAGKGLMQNRYSLRRSGEQMETSTRSFVRLSLGVGVLSTPVFEGRKGHKASNVGRPRESTIFIHFNCFIKMIIKGSPERLLD
jgi:hypothetical protein